jgi:putative cell wall-binding protein
VKTLPQKLEYIGSSAFWNCNGIETVHIPATVEETLSAYKVVRLSGKTRYETNLAILKEAGVSGANEILIATGTNFADSLSASAAGLPLLLVNGKGTSLNDVQTEFLKTMAGKKVTIIGGTGAVSEEMEAAIEAVVGVEAERISGKTRHNTSVLIAQKYFPNADSALITYAQNFPDGLAGGPLAYAMGAPLLLTNAGQEAVGADYISTNKIDAGYVIGGAAAITDDTVKTCFGFTSEGEIPSV